MINVPLDEMEGGFSLEDFEKEKSSLADRKLAKTEWKRGVLGILVTLLCGTTLLVLVLGFTLADMPQDDWGRLTFPLSIDDAKEIGEVLTMYTEARFYNVVIAHATCYLYLQTFAIPGTVFFNVLGGALFGLYRGFFMCLVYNTVGSVFFYSWSKAFAPHIIMRFFPEKMRVFKDKIDEQRQDLTMYMICSRIFPFTPNWFINLSAPHVGIAVVPFSIAIIFGLTPYNFLSCKAGLVLKQLRSKQDIIDTSTTIQLVLVSVFGFILPRLYRNKLDKKVKKKE